MAEIALKKNPETRRASQLVVICAHFNLLVICGLVPVDVANNIHKKYFQKPLNQYSISFHHSKKRIYHELHSQIPHFPYVFCIVQTCKLSEEKLS